ncbi:hypothetical protein M0R45_026721 [Rubus argutus]|uniref:Uncharacterized protein n=1 Tax=Rubus argutus TaxID=59490 RepID=A0AAW1X1U3_RUBAR
MDGDVRRFHRIVYLFVACKEGWNKRLNMDMVSAEYLMGDLKMVRDRSYTFIKDKQKGLGNAITDLFPGAEHRHCVDTCTTTFKSKHAGEGLKQSLWNACKVKYYCLA